MALTITHQSKDWFTPTIAILLAIGIGMLIMYWITDWGTHGFVCSGDTTVICRKEG